MGNRSDAKILEKWERNGKWLQAEMAEKWPPKWKDGQKSHFRVHFSIFRRPFRPGAIFHFLSHFPGIFASGRFPILYMATSITTLSLRLLNALNSEDRGLKVRFSLAMIVFETFELILCQMLSSQGKNAPSNPYPHYLVRLATSRLSHLSHFGLALQN